MKKLLTSEAGEVVHFDSETHVATAVEFSSNKLVTFHSTHWNSGWPVRYPRRGDQITIRRATDTGEFLNARLKDD